MKKLKLVLVMRNVPFTVVVANVGTQDITGIKGTIIDCRLVFLLLMGLVPLIFADADSNSN